jgi:hypothetical protein
MRKEYDFSEASLLKQQRREIDRRVSDVEDRARFILVNPLGPRSTLYYNVSDDCYALNEARSATLFKRRQAATAIRDQLDGSVKVVRCRVDAKGRLVVSSNPKLKPKSPKRRPVRRGKPKARH